MDLAVKNTFDEAVAEISKAVQVLYGRDMTSFESSAAFVLASSHSPDLEGVSLLEASQAFDSDVAPDIWSEHASHFETLLAVPLSSVGCERVFSVVQQVYRPLPRNTDAERADARIIRARGPTATVLREAVAMGSKFTGLDSFSPDILGKVLQDFKATRLVANVEVPPRLLTKFSPELYLPETPLATFFSRASRILDHGCVHVGAESAAAADNADSDDEVSRQMIDQVPEDADGSARLSWAQEGVARSMIEGE